MGEMSASIAHELNQPLSGILSNAAAGQRFIDRGNVDLREVRELLGDIISDGRRASDVVRGIRGMVKKEQLARRSVDLNEVVMDAVRMVSPMRYCTRASWKLRWIQICPRSKPTRFNFNRCC